MSEIIDLTKNSISNCNLRQHAIFCKYIIFVRTVLTDYIHHVNNDNDNDNDNE